MEFLRWRAERWMKVRHMPAGVRARSVVRAAATAPRMLAHTFRGSDLAVGARPGETRGRVRALQGDPRDGAGRTSRGRGGEEARAAPPLPAAVSPAV